jgi:1,4-dihydroxy-2-naphthoate octaprenyltransferase
MRIANLILLVRLARPQFLIASIVLYVLGSLWAVLMGGCFSLSRMILGYLAILPAHLSVSFSNDYYDTAVDALGSPAAFSGGSGVLLSHPKLRRTARWIAITLIFISLTLTIFFTLIFSFPTWFLVILAATNLIGWFYSAPPLSFSYRGWGELSTTIISGLLPITGYLVVYGYMNQDGLLLLPPSLLCGLAFILTVEIPDEEADRYGNKKTWVVRMGRRLSFLGVAGCLFASTAYFFYLSWFSPQVLPVNISTLFYLSLIPMSAGCIGAAARPTEKKTATRLVNMIVFSLTAFLILIDGYFILLIV